MIYNFLSKKILRGFIGKVVTNEEKNILKIGLGSRKVKSLEKVSLKLRPVSSFL